MELLTARTMAEMKDGEKEKRLVLIRVGAKAATKGIRKVNWMDGRAAAAMVGLKVRQKVLLWVVEKVTRRAAL